MNRKRFLFSGYSQKNEVVELKRQLRSVGGVYIDSECFYRDCTHVICKRLGRTQKVLGALASGAWILTPEYVSASYEAGHLLPEGKYEWSIEAGLKEQEKVESYEELQRLPRYFYGAPKRCRVAVAATKRGIFGNWVIAVFVSDVQKEAVYKALLERGGAIVLNLKLPLSRLNRNAAKLTHVFADEGFTDKLVKFRAKGIACVSPDYIRNVLIRDLYCDVNDFSIYRYTSDQDPILKDLKKLSDNARFGGLRTLKAPVTRSTALNLISNSIEPIEKRECLKEVVSVLPCNSQPITKRELLKKSNSVVSLSSQPVAKRGRLKDVVSVVYFGSPPRKKMKKISAMRKCKSGPMDRFVTLTPSPTSSQCSNKQLAESSPLSKPVKSEYCLMDGEGSKDRPIVISDSDDDFVSSKKMVRKRLFCEKTKSMILGNGSKEMPLMIESPPEPCSIKTLTAKLEAIRRTSLVIDNSSEGWTTLRQICSYSCDGSTETSQIIDRPPEPCSSIALKDLRKMSLSNGEGSKEAPLVVDCSPEECSVKAWKALNQICSFNGEGSTYAPNVVDGTSEPCSIKNLKTKLKAIKLANLLSDEGCVKKPVVNDSRPQRCLTRRSKSVVMHKHEEKAPYVISSDSGDEFLLNKPLGAVRRAIQVKPAVCDGTTAFVIDSDYSNGDDDSKKVVTKGSLSVFSQSGSSDVKFVDNEILEMTSLKRGLMTMKDVTPSVLKAFMVLLKDEESALDRICSFSPFSYIELNEASNGCQAMVEKSTVAPVLFTSLLDACIDTKFYEIPTIDYVQFLLSNTYYPEPHIVSDILWTFCLNRDLHISANAFRVLDLILTTHPPNSSKMQLYYQCIICKCKSGLTPSSSSGWDNIIELLEFLYNNPDISKFSEAENTISPEIFRRNCEMTLKFLVRLFEMDLCCTLRKGKDTATLPLIARLIWPNSIPGTVNTAVRRFIDCCLELTLTNINHRIMIVDLCSRLLAAVAECCVSADSKIAARSFCVHPNIGCSLTSLAQSIVQASCERISKSECLHSLLKSLQPLPLRLKVSQFYLESWTCTSTSNDRRLTMENILSLYFPMVNSESKPKMTKAKEDVKMKTSHRVRALRYVPPSPVKGRAEDVNKRNMKGETKLHRACMRNDVEKLRSLLAVPGINILAADNNGWTPLHEACNYGFVDCVRELLAYRPNKPIMEYFKPGSQKEYKLDVLVPGCQGVTPLHDAVINGHTEVARLLLQHGGKSLLEAKMDNGKTPLDCAQTEEIVNVLTGFVQKRPHSKIMSQEESFPSDTNIANKLMMVALYHLVESYVTIHKFHELSELVRQHPNGSYTNSPMKTDVSRESVRSLIEDVKAWVSMRQFIDKLPSTFDSALQTDDFDVGFLVRGFEMLCSTKEQNVSLFL